jgi:hypothetical protein
MNDDHAKVNARLAEKREAELAASKLDLARRFLNHPQNKARIEQMLTQLYGLLPPERDMRPEIYTKLGAFVEECAGIYAKHLDLHTLEIFVDFLESNASQQLAAKAELIQAECFGAGKRWGQELHKVPRGEG